MSNSYQPLLPTRVLESKTAPEYVLPEEEFQVALEAVQFAPALYTSTYGLLV